MISATMSLFKSHKLIVVFILLIFEYSHSNLIAQESVSNNNFVVLGDGLSQQQIIDAAATVSPSKRQIQWQRLETTAFVHFGLNTFYNQEWGRGTEDPKRFNPQKLNTDQWAKIISEAGFKMLIMTCKHHDGFCMWPSKFTKHTVAFSPWREGNGDLVREVSESCHKYNLKFGVYLSPWDRHEATYGNSPAYNLYFLNQLTELLTNYGAIDEVWFDGACGEGPNGKKQIYDWKSYYSLIRKLQPDAVIAVMGPDVRWVGTESGYGRETEWSVVPYEISNQEKIAENSQTESLKEGFMPPGDMENQDLGSRTKITSAKNLIWYPSEVDVSIRPGWFWHESENGRVKSPEKLLDIYFSSVGRNSLLLLNIPPDSTGIINEADERALKDWNNAVLNIFKNNLAVGSKLNKSDNKLIINTLTDKNDTTSYNLTGTGPYLLEIELRQICDFDVLLLQENITVGQRIEHFILEAWIENTWKPVTEGTTVGYKRLLRFSNITTNRIRLIIDECRKTPCLSEIGLYRQLPVAKANPSSGSFRESIEVVLHSTEKNASIHYTTDGRIPDEHSPLYTKPLQFSQTTNLNSIAFRDDHTSGFLCKSSYQKAEFGITLLHAPDEKYDGGGPLGLVDGAVGSIDFTDGRWSGFNGDNLEAIVDLGKLMELHEFGINFNESTKSWIFRPKQVEFRISENGNDYKTIYSETFGQPETETEKLIQVKFSKQCKARFIKVKANNFGNIPSWHPAKGEKSWLFIDEIIAR